MFFTPICTAQNCSDDVAVCRSVYVPKGNLPLQATLDESMGNDIVLQLKY